MTGYNIVLACIVMLGGALGAVCRVSVNNMILLWWASSFPIGILCINMAGSLVMGVLTGLLSRRLFGQAWVNAFVGTGFLGGFTTFSSFALDTVRLWQEGQFFFAAGNILLNTIGCMLLAGLGWMLTYRSEH